MTINQLLESFRAEFSASEAKAAIIDHLEKQGYKTYAERLKAFNFVIADYYKGAYCQVAFFMFDDNTVCINPSMISAVAVKAPNDNKSGWKKMFDQLSVLIRHELLHFLLRHSVRFINYLKQKYPNDWRWYSSAGPIRQLSNVAADYDLSKFYDEEDKEVVRLMTLNNEVVGGLILSDDHPYWMNLSYDQLLDELLISKSQVMDELQKQLEELPVINIKKVSHSPEYIDIYNKVIKLFDKKSYSDSDLTELLDKLSRDEELIDAAGNVILKQGE